jgi:hypothetical protein
VQPVSDKPYWLLYIYRSSIVLILCTGILVMAKRQNEGMLRLADSDDVYNEHNPDTDNENGKLMADHTPATLSFREINYFVGKIYTMNILIIIIIIIIIITLLL